MKKIFNKESYTKEIGARIKEFAEKKFGSVSALSEAIEINHTQLLNYIYRKEKQPLPGAEILFKLHEAGCDINWLLSGKHSHDKLGENKILQKYDVDEIIKAIEVYELLKKKI